MKCEKCGNDFPISWKNPETGKIHNLCNRKYCLDCSPFNQHNTRDLSNKVIVGLNESQCTTCKQIKPIADFYERSRNGSKKGVTSMCRSCLNLLTLKRQRDRKKQAIDYKGGKCELCGYSKCQDAFDFHHINPEEKEFLLSAGKLTSFERIKNELDKCMLLCANCHREIHAKK